MGGGSLGEPIFPDLIRSRSTWPFTEPLISGHFQSPNCGGGVQKTVVVCASAAWPGTGAICDPCTLPRKSADPLPVPSPGGFADQASQGTEVSPDIG